MSLKKISAVFALPAVVILFIYLQPLLWNKNTSKQLAAVEYDSGPQVNLTREEQEYLEKLGPVTICPDPDWIPFEHVDDNGNFTGIAADMLDIIFNRLDMEFTYIIPENWDEAIALSKAGKVHILPFLNQTPEREEWLIFSEPLLIDPNVFITREEHPYIPDASELTDKTIVFPGGTSMEERVRKDFPNLTVINVPTENEAFQAVSNRSADMTLRSLTISAYTIRKEGFFNLKIAGQAPEKYVNRLRMGILKSEPILRSIINKGIDTITSREREEIINRHVNITVVKPMDYMFILRIAAVLAALIGMSFYWNIRLRKINAALNESERSKSVLLENLPGMAYRCRNDSSWTMEFISEGCLDLTGYKNTDLIFNRVLSFNDLLFPEDRDWIWQKWEKDGTSRKPVSLEYRIKTADKKIKWVFEQGVFIFDSNNQIEAIEGLIIDITDRKHAEEELIRISIHDYLTGIYNRKYIFERFESLIIEHKRSGRKFSIAIIDLDYFKKINDTHGHPAGDFILREFAQLLKESLRPYDLTGRYGGEEFITVIMNADNLQAVKMLDRLKKTISSRIFNFNGKELRITFSAGVSNIIEPGDDLTFENLIHIADQRLLSAKENGRDRIVYK